MNTYLRSWLLYRDRLTDRLIEEAGEALLQVLNQGFSALLWQREIVIVAKGEPCWYARTMVPKQTYFAYRDFFDQVETKSLGALIYHSPIVQRTSMTHYPIGHAAVEFQWLPEEIQRTCDEALWLRSSYFKLGGNCSGLSTEPTSRGLSAGCRNLTASLDPADKPRDVGDGRVVTLGENHSFYLKEIFLPAMQRYCK